VSVEPYSDFFGYFATKDEIILKMYLQILAWTALRSLRPEFFMVCNEMSTGDDVSFYEYR
jgi:hypothetical protein